MTDEKTFKIVNGDISDGYHTFGELYEHRCLLFLYAVINNAFVEPIVVYDHYEGWDLISAYTDAQRQQISYHVPVKYRRLYSRLPTKLDRAKKGHLENNPLPPSVFHDWDGHTADDVLKRLIAAMEE